MITKEIQVLYIVKKLELDGAQKVCLSLLDGIQNLGQKAFLISGTQGTLADEIQPNPHIILLNNFKREVSLKGIFQEIKNFFNLIAQIRKIKKENPNLIIHTHSTKAGLLGRWAALFAGVKTRIHTIHGFGFHPYQNKGGWLMNYVLEFITSFITTHYICVSSADVKTGIKLLPRFTYKHSIIRAAVDWEQFYKPATHTNHAFPSKPSNNRQAQSKTFIFGTVSCFKQQKNLFDMFKAFELAWQHNNNIELFVIGDGDLRPKLQKWIRNHKLKSHIILLGWQKNVAPFMQQWDAFVLSSLWEGLPCAIIEARLQKLPVVAYNTGGIHDVIVHGENGLLYTPGDWKGLGRGMLEVANNPSLEYALRNYTEDLSAFDTKDMIKKHLDLYKSL